MIIDLEAWIKDHYWNGWWWDRACLYVHPGYDKTCDDCKKGNWTYTKPTITSLKRFGDKINPNENTYMTILTRHIPFVWTPNRMYNAYWLKK